MAVLDWMILKVLSNFDDSMVLDVLMFQSLYGNIRFRGLRGNLRHEKCWECHKFVSPLFDPPSWRKLVEK